MAITLDVGKSIQLVVTDDGLATLQTHSEAFAHVIMIGLKNLVQDSHASVKREDFTTEDEWKAASRAKAELKLGAILAGDVRVQRASATPKLSDFDAFARKWIIGKVKAKMGKADWDKRVDAEDGAAFIQSVVDKNFPKVEEAIRADYTEELKKRERAKAIEADIEI